jgi:hypothetical protein
MKKACMGLVKSTTKLAQLEGFSQDQKRSPLEETLLVLNILHQEP